MKYYTIYILVLSVLLCMSCNKQTEDETILKDIQAKIAQQYPAVDGSTSTHPLQRKIACDILGLPWTWSDNSNANIHRTIIPDELKTNDVNAIKTVLAIQPSGTHGSYMNLIDGKTDFILVARAPSQDELDHAGKTNVALNVKAVALDAFVFLTHSTNPIENLSLKQVVSIYSGGVEDWTELGITIREGSNAQSTAQPITAYQRNRNSGSQELMDKLVMKEVPAMDMPELITNSMLGPYNVIGGDRWTGDGGDPLGLGYTVYFYGKFMFPHTYVKIMKINGIMPDAETIAAKKYPLYTEVFAAVRETEAKDSTAALLMTWIFTPTGQASVGESGYVPVLEKPLR